MSKLKKEAMGQYNYVAPTPIPKQGARKQARHSYPDFYPHTDVTVEIVDPHNFKLLDIKPPKMFDTSYFSDFRHPPAENYLPYRSKEEVNDSKYTAYLQSPRKTHNGKEHDKKQISSQPVKVLGTEQLAKPDRAAVKSAGDFNNKRPKAGKQSTGVARAQSAEVNQRPTKQEKINEEFYRSLLKARSGSEWKRPPDISYDILNPEKPSLKRETMPYGSQMELNQEKIANAFGERKNTKRPSTVGGGIKADIQQPECETPLPTAIVSPPFVKRIGASGQIESSSASRVSTRSGRRSIASFDHYNLRARPASSSSLVSSIGDDFLLETGRHLNETLETIQEEEILDQLKTPSPVHSPKPRAMSEYKKRPKKKLKKPLPPTDLFTKRGPDPRFYASKKNLRTPNEMERFRKARGRAFMRNVEQAIPELDFTDHEVKYQPERQLFQDARWRIRKDVKDVRDKNLHSLVDRFEKRHQIIKEETRTRLGDPTYIGRAPVSIYKLQEVTDNERERKPNGGFDVKYPLHNRRRVTPSLGSVQRARNLGSHAQIFNQACAPPYWGPQKVDHALFLPQMAQGI